MGANAIIIVFSLIVVSLVYWSQKADYRDGKVSPAEKIALKRAISIAKNKQIVQKTKTSANYASIVRKNMFLSTDEKKDEDSADWRYIESS